MHPFELRKPTFQRKLNSYNLDFLYFVQRSIPEKLYPLMLFCVYKKNIGKNLNLKNPQTFSEKIQWLKLNKLSSIKTQFSDKLEAKKIVKSLLPDLSFAKVYDSANSFEQLDFSKCPNTFILKTNHSCRTTSIVVNKNEFLKDKEKFTLYSSFYRKHLGKNFAFSNFFELQYKDIVPQIFAEEYVIGDDKTKYREHHVYCFNGEPFFINEIAPTYFKNEDPFRSRLYMLDWSPAKFAFFYDIKREIPKPSTYDKLLEYSKVLSKDFSFVRVDFIEYEQKLYFGEMTFTPMSGFMKIIPNEYDLILGEKLKIN